MNLEILKTGTFTSSNGLTRSFTEIDLDTIANTYNPTEHEAPLTIGHPKDNSPAHGWVKKLFRQGETLFAEVDNFSDKLKEGLKNKFFKKRSIALYPDLKLRHIGFVPVPAVKGLADIPEAELFALSDDENNLESFEADFNETDLLESVEVTKDEETTEEISTEEKSEENPEQISAEQKPSEKSEIKSEAKITDEVLLKSLKEFSEKLDQFLEFTESFDSKNFIENNSEKISSLHLQLDLAYFSENLAHKVESRNILPATKEKIISIIEFISGFNFSENENSFSKELYSRFEMLIDTLPKIQLTEEFAEKPEKDPDLPEEVFEFAEVDDSSRTLHRDAVNLMKKENITYLESVKRILTSR